jgi:DNA-binding NtrC family response regulator
MPTVLIVDDQERVAKAISLLLDLHGIGSISAEGPDEALAALGRQPVDLVVQDMNFTPGETSGAEGLELFRAIRAEEPEIPVLLITAWASVETAVRLMKEGASDYVQKPWDDDKLIAGVRNLLRLRALEVENRRLKGDLRRARDELAERYDLRGLVYASAAMHDVVSLAVRVARADVPVLITGANGTGKEKLAEVVQSNSPRRDGPFVKVNVGGLPESLLEAELFGAEAGAYTGAGKRRVGRFEAADGGTLLLDEIGNLSATGQMKLLRVLQTGEFERLGSSKPVRVDVRVIAATNVDLRRAIERGEFREDLFFRLNVIELTIPPLRDRPHDVGVLAESFLRELPPVNGQPPPKLSTASRQALVDYPWPGNVRELRNCIQRAALVAPGSEIEPGDLGLDPRDRASIQPAVPRPAIDENGDDERERIEAALVDCGGVVSQAASELGMSRQALYRRMEKLGLVVERRVRG